MGVLYAVGALLFLVPAVASLWSSADAVFVTFFAGSLFFTAAATLQLVAAFETPHRLLAGREPHPLRPRQWMPARIDWISAAIQWPGTLLFNLNTFDALDRALDSAAQDVRIWTPDVIGSGCFLVSALLAFANTEHEWLSWRPRDVDWQIGATNLLGAIAFGVSAIAAYVRPDGGSELSDTTAALGTAVGALGFLVGAVLLPVQDAATLRNRSCRR